MLSTPIFVDGLWQTACVKCPNLIKHRYKSQLTKYCSISCYMTGNTHRQGHVPVNAYKKGENIGAKNNKWAGDKVGYFALHDWVSRVLGRPKQCENCGTTKHTRYEWANISGEYKRDTSDWARLCKMCHFLIDDIARKWHPDKVI